MKILVTGSAGHLGEALMRTLRDSNHEPIGLDVLPSPFTDLVGSIADRTVVRDAMRRNVWLVQRRRVQHRIDAMHRVAYDGAIGDRPDDVRER